MSVSKTALVLGATGGVGCETAMALARRGWRLRLLHRRPQSAASTLPDAEWIAGDAMNDDDVVRAAEGVALVFHGVNPPGYKNWRGLALPMLENTIAAARTANALIAFPGNVYNYGPDAFPILTEDSIQRPHTRKGAIRVEMEDRLAQAARDGVRVLILRGGDFFGPHTGNSWFSQGLVKPGKTLRAITYPGAFEVGHAWAYLPDFAEAFARLIEREAELGAFESFHFAGHWLARGVEIAELIREVAKAPNLPIRRFPWAAAIAMSPFVPLFRELAEMRYLWMTPVRLDNAKLVSFLGEEPHTDICAALRATLTALGCLSGAEPGEEHRRRRAA